MMKTSLILSKGRGNKGLEAWNLKETGQRKR